MQIIESPRGRTEKSLTERVAEEVRVLMLRHGVTQMQMVQVLHVSQTAVSKRLRGRTPFDVNEIAMLADFFGVDVTALLGDHKNSQHPVEEPAAAHTTRGKELAAIIPLHAVNS